MIYAYIRVSTEDQSCSSQRYEIENWSARNNIPIDRLIEESVSGTVAPEKRKLGRLLKKMGKGDVLVCTELSRLGRSMLMIMSVLSDCSDKGVEIRSIKDNFMLDSNINSKIIAFAFALAAEIERTLISQRTKEALADRKAAGVVLGRPPGSSRKKDAVMAHREEIKGKLSSGQSVSSVAREFGIHRETLRRYLAENH